MTFFLNFSPNGPFNFVLLYLLKSGANTYITIPDTILYTWLSPIFQ